MATAQVEERQLLKAMTWWDGFVIALANPGFLIAALGFSIGALGTTGAFVLWTISVCLGALQNNIYAELATMFPNKAGGISLFAHEAWRKYFTFVGPIATFGYWFAWSSVLAINGLVVGTLIQAEWFSDSTWAEAGGGFDFTLPIVLGMVAIVLVWAFNIFGVRPAVWLGYVTGGLLLIPAFVLMFLPYITGDWSSDNMQWEIGAGGGLGLALVWLYFMGWSAYGFETVAAFAPEYHDTETDTPRGAARVGGVLGGGLRAAAAWRRRDDRHGGRRRGRDRHRLLHAGVRHPRRKRARQRDDLLPGGGPVAVDEHRDDGRLARPVRDLPGRDDDQAAGVLNRYNVPARAMTLDALLNLFLITYFASAIEILAAGNLGYILAHVFALTGFLLLRRDRPNWPRPIRLSAIWVPIAGLLAAINMVFIIWGGFIYADEYGYGLDKTRVGLIVLGRLAGALRLPPRGAGPHGDPPARGDADHAGGRGGGARRGQAPRQPGARRDRSAIQRRVDLTVTAA